MRYQGLSPRTRIIRWGLLAVSLGVVLGATVPEATRALATTILERPANLAWYAERLVGFLAYFALAASVLYGLLLSTKILDTLAQRAVTFALHQDLAAVGLGLAAIHGALLGLDHTMPFSLAEIALPFAAPYRPLWVGVGQLAFYLTFAVVASFYLRRRIGQRAWRLLHYATFLAFLGATAHGLAAGTDSSTPWAWWAYVGSSAAVVFLLTYRITLSLGRRVGGPVGRVVQPVSSKATSSR
jgi:predicted ferric reductase